MTTTEKEIQLKDQDGRATDINLSTKGEKIIVQPVPSYQDQLIAKVADQVLLQSTGTGLGVLITIGGAVFVAKWLGIPEMVKDFIASQKNMADSFSRLVDRIGDTVNEVEKTANKVDLIDRRIEKVEDKLDHVEKEISKLDR